MLCLILHILLYGIFWIIDYIRSGYVFKLFFLQMGWTVWTLNRMHPTASSHILWQNDMNGAQERLAAAERLAAFEAHSTQMREELQALRVEVQVRHFEVFERCFSNFHQEAEGDKDEREREMNCNHRGFPNPQYYPLRLKIVGSRCAIQG